MADETNLNPASESDAPSLGGDATLAGVPGEVSAEAMGVLDDVLTGFASALSPAELADAREFLLDVMAAQPLGILLGERLRERPAPPQTEERAATHVGVEPSSATEDDDRQKARGAG